MTDCDFPVVSDRLAVGDALILYTDGVIEVPGRDLMFGIDKLLGAAEQLVAHGWRSGPRALIDAVAESPSDDRAVVLIRKVPRHLLSDLG
jgi:serine phosphatase RsbU (regulator of sigma subunit)